MVNRKSPQSTLSAPLQQGKMAPDARAGIANWRESIMKIQIALMAAVAPTALAGTSMAASLNDVIQKGPAAAKILEKNEINFATAKGLGHRCVAEDPTK